MNTKKHATKVKDVSEQWGKPAWEYSDGSIRGERGYMLRQLPGTVPITHETAGDLHALRQQRTAEAMAEAISSVTSGRLGIAVGPAEAVGAVTGILWRDIVLADPQDGVYPRDRIQAFDTLTQRAGLLANPKQAQSEPAQVQHTHTLDPSLLALLRDVRDRREAIDATVSDA